MLIGRHPPGKISATQQTAQIQHNFRERRNRGAVRIHGKSAAGGAALSKVTIWL
jgi:hypothetical protein